MQWAEWKTSYRWVPISILLSVLIATGLTMVFIFPFNEAMSIGITDPGILQKTLEKWIFLNKIRVGLWTSSG